MGIDRKSKGLFDDTVQCQNNGAFCFKCLYFHVAARESLALAWVLWWEEAEAFWSIWKVRKRRWFENLIREIKQSSLFFYV